MNNKLTIAVIGLGLIGGSILKSLRLQDFNLIGISRSPVTVKKAFEQGLVNEYSTNLDICKSADIVFICTPINKTLDMIDKVSRIVSENCIITDVASLKGFVIDYVNSLEKPVRFIGGHPMAGTEYQGLDNALDCLFDGAKWVLTPSKYSDNNDFKKLSHVISLLSAEVIKANPHEHDKATALISHFPLLLSQALFAYVESYSDPNIKTLALQLAASGFRDSTRLSATNIELSKDMLCENMENVLQCAEGLKEQLTFLCDKLSQDRDEFIRMAQELAQKRKNMYSEEGKNIFLIASQILCKP